MKDLKTLQMVCKKFGINMEKLRHNPIPLTDENRKYFPNIETQRLYSKTDKKFKGKFEGITDKNRKVLFPATLQNNGIVKYEKWYPVDYDEYKGDEDREITTYHKGINGTYAEWNNLTDEQKNALKKADGDVSIKFSSYKEWDQLGDTVKNLIKEATKNKQNENISNIEIPFTYDDTRAYVNGATTYTIPEGVTSLGNDCFMNCGELTSITIPNSVTSLGNNCFYECSSLQSITIPNSVTSLGNMCFWSCENLEEIKVVIGENGETGVYDKLRDEYGDKVKLVDIGEEVIEI